MKNSSAGAAKGSGFTLVELLVVVAIIAALMALLIPGTALVMRYVETVKCQHNLRQIAHAVLAYATAHQGYLPPEGYNGGPPEINSLRLPAILVYTEMIGAPNTADLGSWGPMSTEHGRNPFYCPAALPIHGGSAALPTDDKVQGCYRQGSVFLKVDSWFYSNSDSHDRDVPFVRQELNSGDYTPFYHHISELKDRSTLVIACDGWFANGIRNGNYRIAARHWGEDGRRSDTNMVFFDCHVDRYNRRWLEEGFRSGLHRDRPPYFRLSDQ